MLPFIKSKASGAPKATPQMEICSHFFTEKVTYICWGQEGGVVLERFSPWHTRGSCHEYPWEGQYMRNRLWPAHTWVHTQLSIPRATKETLYKEHQDLAYTKKKKWFQLKWRSNSTGYFTYWSWGLKFAIERYKSDINWDGPASIIKESDSVWATFHQAP